MPREIKRVGSQLRKRVLRREKAKKLGVKSKALGQETEWIITAYSGF